MVVPGVVSLLLTNLARLHDIGALVTVVKAQAAKVYLYRLPAGLLRFVPGVDGPPQGDGTGLPTRLGVADDAVRNFCAHVVSPPVSALSRRTVCGQDSADEPSPLRG
jgi:hypothetical protein